MHCAIFLHHAETETANARIESEPEVEPNCKAKRAGSELIITCVWKTPKSAAIEVMRRRIQTIHLPTMQPVEQELVGFLLRRAIGRRGKKREVSGGQCNRGVLCMHENFTRLARRFS